MVSLSDTIATKNARNLKICQLENEIDVTHSYTVTPKVIKLIDPSNDGQRYLECLAAKRPLWVIEFCLHSSVQ
jgi:hypothetical protein